MKSKCIEVNGVTIRTAKQKVKRTGGERVLRIFVFCVFCVECLIMLFPLFFMLVTSVKDSLEYITNPVFSLPEEIRFSNYIRAYNEIKVNGVGLPMMFFNSLWYATGMVFGNLMVCSMFAYIIARYPFPGSRAIYSAILIMMALPVSGNAPAIYRLYGKLGLINSPFYVISNWGFMGYNFIFLERFFRYVAKDYAEAAQIDGAGHARTYFSIIFPQIINVASALALTQFITYWNDNAAQLLYLRELPNLATGLYFYEKVMNRKLDIPLYYAGLVVSLLPVIIIFICFQNTIMEKISGGGLKG